MSRTRWCWARFIIGDFDFGCVDCSGRADWLLSWVGMYWSAALDLCWLLGVMTCLASVHFYGHLFRLLVGECSRSGRKGCVFTYRPFLAKLHHLSGSTDCLGKWLTDRSWRSVVAIHGVLLTIGVDVRQVRWVPGSWVAFCWIVWYFFRNAVIRWSMIL